jgi:hypothetical protein
MERLSIAQKVKIGSITLVLPFLLSYEYNEDKINPDIGDNRIRMKELIRVLKDPETNLKTAKLILEKGGKNYCSGTIIRNKRLKYNEILTAKHCVKVKEKENLILGESYKHVHSDGATLVKSNNFDNIILNDSDFDNNYVWLDSQPFQSSEIILDENEIFCLNTATEETEVGFNGATANSYGIGKNTIVNSMYKGNSGMIVLRKTSNGACIEGLLLSSDGDLEDINRGSKKHKFVYTKPIQNPPTFRINLIKTK